MADIANDPRSQYDWAARRFYIPGSATDPAVMARLPSHMPEREGRNVASPGGGIYVRVETIGGERIERTLRKLAERFETPEMMETFELMMEALEKYYKGKWDDDWPGYPRKAATSQNPDDQLYVTGALMRSMIKHDDENAVRRVTPEGFEFGTRVFYGHFVNSGTKNMRPRPFMRMTLPMRNILLEVIATRVGMRPDLRFKSGFAPL